MRGRRYRDRRDSWRQSRDPRVGHRRPAGGREDGLRRARGVDGREDRRDKGVTGAEPLVLALQGRDVGEHAAELCLRDRRLMLHLLRVPRELRFLQLLLPRRHGLVLGDEVAPLTLAVLDDLSERAGLALTVLQTFSEAVVLGDQAADIAFTRFDDFETTRLHING